MMDTLWPNTPLYDLKLENNVLFATQNRNYAITFSFTYQAIVAGIEGSVQVRIKKEKPYIQLNNLVLNVDATGYLYQFSARNFTRINEMEWVCFKEVLPDNRIKIVPSDYLNWF
jgi:hypothetical protein